MLTWDGTSWVAGAGGGVASVGVAGQLTNRGTATNPIITTLGGLVSVAEDLTGRNAIPANQRNVGMQAYKVDTGQTWQLVGGIANANWVDVTVYSVSIPTAASCRRSGRSRPFSQSTGTAAVWNAPALQRGLRRADHHAD